jgi:CheY-like chemotaxis protein
MSAGVPAEKTVLVVEDEDVNRALLRAILATTDDPVLRSVTIVEAWCLAEARSSLAQRNVDLVLLDVRLPDGSGLDLARELAASATRPRIIVLSASVLPTERQAALDSGCDAFLGKPYDVGELISLLNRLLSNGQG